MHDDGVAHFTVVLERQLSVGLLIGVGIPEEREEVPDAALAALAPEERAAALALEGFRRSDFVGGRLAFREAARRLGVQGSLSSGGRGEPVSPPGWSVSVSHKRPLAVALVAPAAQGAVGVDLEGGEARERLSIAERVLRPEEQRVLDALEPAQRWAHLQRVFALKEAVYKAVHPFVQRYVGFHEASVAALDHARYAVQMCWAAELEQGRPSPVLAVSGEVQALEGFVLALAVARVAGR